MDVYILNLIFRYQKELKKQTEIRPKDVWSIIKQNGFSNIKSESGVYSAIERMEKNGLIKKRRIKKLPPETFISLTEKGLEELKKYNNESETPPQSRISNQSQDKPIDLTSSLEESQFKIDSLTESLEESKKKIQSVSQTLKKSQEENESLKKSLKESQSSKITPEITYAEKELPQLSDTELKKRGKRVMVKFIDAANMDEEDFSHEQLENMEEVGIDIIEYARE